MWKCPKCKREFLKNNQLHSCVIYPLVKHFEGKKEIARPLFDKLIQSIEKNIGPVKIESLPCCIHLVGGYTFSGVWATKDKINIDFRSDTDIEDPRIIKKLKISVNRIMYYMSLKSEKDIDKKLISWLKTAYFLNTAKK
jgi:hypothetical protein